MFDKVFDWLFAWFDQTAGTSLRPVALGAIITISVDELQTEGHQSLVFFNNGFPVSSAPPLVESRRFQVEKPITLFEQNVCHGPYFLVHSST